MSNFDGQIDALYARRNQLRADLERALSAASRAGRAKLAAGEQQELANLRGIEARIGELESERERAGDSAISALSSRVNSRSTNGGTMNTRLNDGHLTYNRDLCYRSGDKKVSWMNDLLKFSAGADHTGEARQRLFRHAQEVQHDPVYQQFEQRDISRVDSQGGYAVPPAWLVNQYIELARPGRAFANLVQRQPLPGGTDSINIPKLLTGTAVGIQTADNTSVTDVDLTDTFVNAPVRTIAGQQGVSLQLIDQSPIAFDDVVFRDLVAAHAAATDAQVISGTGTNGQVLGVNYTPGISTISVDAVTIQGIYSALANAIQLVHTTRYLPPEVIVMHPRRWGWLLSLLGSDNRPLFLPLAGGNNAYNAAGILEDVASQQIVGTTHGLPIVTDPNIATTTGSEYLSYGDEDVIYVLRASDLVLWESGIRARVLPETKAANLTVLLQIYSYLAFSAARFPASVVTVSGLTAPTF